MSLTKPDGDPRILVIGAGLSGCMAAWCLRKELKRKGLGARIAVCDGARGCGGRLATQRVNASSNGSENEVRMNMGAQQLHYCDSLLMGEESVQKQLLSALVADSVVVVDADTKASGALHPTAASNDITRWLLTKADVTTTYRSRVRTVDVIDSGRSFSVAMFGDKEKKTFDGVVFAGSPAEVRTTHGHMQELVKPMWQQLASKVQYTRNCNLGIAFSNTHDFDAVTHIRNWFSFANATITSTDGDGLKRGAGVVVAVRNEVVKELCLQTIPATTSSESDLVVVVVVSTEKYAQDRCSHLRATHRPSPQDQENARVVSEQLLASACEVLAATLSSSTSIGTKQKQAQKQGQCSPVVEQLKQAVLTKKFNYWKYAQAKPQSLRAKRGCAPVPCFVAAAPTPFAVVGDYFQQPPNSGSSSNQYGASFSRILASGHFAAVDIVNRLKHPASMHVAAAANASSGSRNRLTESDKQAARLARFGATQNSQPHMQQQPQVQLRAPLPLPPRARQERMRVLVVGAGLCGALTAYLLKHKSAALAAGSGCALEVVVVEMARGAGGRMSTTRWAPATKMKEQQAQTRANTGAQYVSIATPGAAKTATQALVRSAIRAGVLSARPLSEEQTFPHSRCFDPREKDDYAAVQGTNSVVKHFLYLGADSVHFETRIKSLTLEAGAGAGAGGRGGVSKVVARVIKSAPGLDASHATGANGGGIAGHSDRSQGQGKGQDPPLAKIQKTEQTLQQRRRRRNKGKSSRVQSAWGEEDGGGDGGGGDGSGEASPPMRARTASSSSSSSRSTSSRSSSSSRSTSNRSTSNRSTSNRSTSSSTRWRAEFSAGEGSGGSRTTGDDVYDAVIVAMPPKDSMRIGLAMTAAAGAAAAAGGAAGKKLELNLPQRVREKLHQGQRRFVGRFSIAFWWAVSAQAAGFVERAVRNFRELARKANAQAQSLSAEEKRTLAVLDAVVPQQIVEISPAMTPTCPDRPCLVIQSTEAFWIAHSNVHAGGGKGGGRQSQGRSAGGLDEVRGGGREAVKNQMIGLLQTLAAAGSGGGRAKGGWPKPAHVKMLNWRTSQVKPQQNFDGSASATPVIVDHLNVEKKKQQRQNHAGRKSEQVQSAPLLFTGDWCSESSFQGCADAAQACSEAALRMLLVVNQ